MSDKLSPKVTIFENGLSAAEDAALNASDATSASPELRTSEGILLGVMVVLVCEVERDDSFH